MSNSVEKAMKLPTENNLLFLSNFQVLKPLEREKLLEFIKNKSVILHTNSNIEDLELPVSILVIMKKISIVIKF